MKNLVVKTELLHARKRTNGQTEGQAQKLTDLSVVLRTLANAPKRILNPDIMVCIILLLLPPLLSLLLL
jgi:hypothetical protein